jgi:hypothetical protein
MDGACIIRHGLYFIFAHAPLKSTSAHAHPDCSQCF